MDKEQARAALLGVNLVVGLAFLLFPKLSMRLYGVDADANPAAAYPLRYIGARSLLFSAMLLDEDAADVLTEQTPVIVSADLTASGLALITGEVPRRAAVLGALTSGLTATLGMLGRDG